MTVSNYEFEVAIYLKGEELDPDYISGVIGVAPSMAHFKGVKRITSTGREYATKIGLWTLAAEGELNDLSVLINGLVLKIENRKLALQDIIGVQEAYVDIFVAMDADEDGEGTCAFKLSRENVQALDSLGIPAHITVAIVKK
jgi:hypothetical protein